MVEVADVVKSTPEASTKGITTIKFSNSKYSISIRIGTDFLEDGIYKFTDFPIPGRNQVGIVVFPEPFVPGNYFTSNTGGNLTVQGNNLQIDFLTLLKNGDSKKEMKASCNISL